MRAAAYAELGIATVCRTSLMVDAMNAYLGFPPSGLAGMLAPSGHHPGGNHHADTGSPSVGDATAPRTRRRPTPGAAMEA